MCINRKTVSMCSILLSSSGITIKAKPYLRGQREGKAIMYEVGTYPHGAIAPVHFLWQAPPPPSSPPPPVERQEDKGVHIGNTPPLTNPKKGRDSEHLRSTHANVLKLWIWCHPASHKQVLSELVKVVESYNEKLYQDATRHKVGVVHRNLVRFCLRGPRSHAVLMETLKPRFIDNRHGLVNSSDASLSEASIDVDCDEDCGGEEELDGSGKLERALPPAEKWWLEGDLKAQVSSHVELLDKVYPDIKMAAEPADFPRGVVIGLCVEDPRFFTPSKKTDVVSSCYPQKKNRYGTTASHHDKYKPNKSTLSQSTASESGSSVSTNSLPFEIAFSPLWDYSVSNSVSRSLIPCHLLNRERSKKLVRASILKLGDASPCIPVLLIQQTPLHSSRSSHSSREYMGAGWDLVLPRAWAMAFWISLIYRGARVCGMEELAKANLETQVLHFPHDFPDTLSGNVSYFEHRTELEALFSRKPPAKRLNYGKLVIPNPFDFPWQDLVKVWLSRKVPFSTRMGRDVPFCAGMEPKRSRGNALSEPENIYTLRNYPFYVLRSKDDLYLIRQFISTILAKNTFGQVLSSEARAKRTLQDAIWNFGIGDIVKNHGNALVAVRIEIYRSGNVAALDCLSLPYPMDLWSLLADKTNSYSGPTEEINQHGMTIVKDGNITIGISSLTKKMNKELQKKIRGK